MAKRRANGEGNIRKRKDGRWEGRYNVGYNPETQRYITKNVLGKTQAEVKEKLKKAIEESERLDSTRTGKYTIASWLRSWLNTYGVVYMRPSTLRNYKGFLTNQIAPAIGDKPLESITNRELQLFFNSLSASGRVARKESENQPSGLSAKTIRNIYNFMSHALDKAVEEKLILQNPAKGCVLPKKERPEMKTLPLDKLSDFFDEAKRSGVYELYYTELSTGLRRGELLGLKWSDIDFSADSINVKRQVMRVDGEVIEATLKTRNAYRTIVVSPEVTEMLKAKKEKENSASEYVFSSPNGGPISPDSVLHMLHRVLNRAGLEAVRFHDLRHTFATLALQNGVDVKTLSNMLGHYSAGFTLDTYTHVTPQMQQDAAKKVGGFLAGNAGTSGETQQYTSTTNPACQTITPPPISRRR